MKDRIAHIMRAKNLKASDFATLLGIQPSAVSHILAGRNNPSLEFVKKIKETFPEYNLDWIVFGTGPMTLSEPFRDSFKEALKNTVSDGEDSSVDVDPTLTKPQYEETQISLFPQQDPMTPAPQTAAKNEDDAPSPSAFPLSNLINSDIKSIIVLYNDGTFENFDPR